MVGGSFARSESLGTKRDGDNLAKSDEPHISPSRGISDFRLFIPEYADGYLGTGTVRR